MTQCKQSRKLINKVNNRKVNNKKKRSNSLQRSTSASYVANLKLTSRLPETFGSGGLQG